MEPVIEATKLGRTYDSYEKTEGLRQSLIGLFNRKQIKKAALLPTDLTVHRGEVIGLVGANGAGKTTLIKILSGLIHPSSGSCRVLGFEPWKRPHAYLRQMSVLLGQKAQLWWDIPASDSFALLGQIYGVERPVLNSRIQELAEILQVQNQLNVQLRRLSLGERMKMEFIGCLLHRPKVIFLDEPTIGLDIVAQSAIRTFLNEYVKKENPTILLTSHYMDDIAGMASRLLLMSHGELVYNGTVNDFRSAASSNQRLMLRLEVPLTQPLDFRGKVLLRQGDSVFRGEMAGEDVAPWLSLVMSHAKIVELTIEQTDFEDVIHKFLAKESRLRDSRHAPTAGVSL